MKYYLIGFLLSIVFMGGVYGALGMPTCKEYGYRYVPERIVRDKGQFRLVEPAHYDQFCLVWN